MNKKKYHCIPPKLLKFLTEESSESLKGCAQLRTEVFKRKRSCPVNAKLQNSRASSKGRGAAL
ncbi:hypothetical protein DPEC_G00108290 [Dallia pectoralis]|uniref:Uncharacterized protein n=1 Tax=Dallia pectoralis TaxID=75939 RepID=A0ACC2GS25_DALPE|nr:hypothetical protein DPEC_G00108290 [Dallia pectoralis]